MRTHAARPALARSNQWIPNTPRLGLTWGSIRSKSSMANCTLQRRDRRRYVRLRIGRGRCSCGLKRLRRLACSPPTLSALGGTERGRRSSSNLHKGSTRALQGGSKRRRMTHQSTHVRAGATSHGKQRAKKSDAYKRNPECAHSAHAHHEHHRERRHTRILPMATREERSVRIGSATQRTGRQATTEAEPMPPG